MATVVVHHAHQRGTYALELVLSTGARVALDRLSPTVSGSGVAAHGTVDVEGQKSITRPTGPGLRTMSMTTVVGNTGAGRDEDVEARLATLQRIADNGWEFRLAGAASKLETGYWWRAVGFTVRITHRNGRNQPARAVVEWDLVEHVPDRRKMAGAGKPSAPKKAAPSAPKATTRNYTVQAGDYPWKIAQRLLGDGQRWKEIYALNKSKLKNMNDIKVGTVLKVPVR